MDGKTFNIRQNLFDALQRLRFPDRPRQLWIDAICINQSDSVEKTEQVALMGQIYAHAIRVIVWLGKASSRENDSRAYELFRWASPLRTLHPWRKEGGVWEMPPLSTVLQNFNDLKAEEPFKSPSTIQTFTLDNIEQFLARPWFSRRWIVQEICNAREIILVFGPYELSWKDFSAALNTLSMAPDDSRSLEKYPAQRLMIWRNGVMMDSVLEGMEAFHDFEGSDDRDRIAAFLNLRWPHTAQGSDFVVDYSQSVVDNYHRLAVHMVDIGKGADVLITAAHCHRNIGERQGSLPSWVPDWCTIRRRKLRSRLWGTFDVKITREDCLEFSGRISHVFATDVKSTVAGVETIGECSQSLILPKKGDIVCHLISEEGDTDQNSVVLRRFEGSEYHVLVAARADLYEWVDCMYVPEPAEQSRRFLVK